MVTSTGRRSRAPQDTPPSNEQVLLAAERTARWGKVILALCSLLGGVLLFLATTGATVLEVPQRQNRMEARQDTVSSVVRALRSDFDAHVAEEKQVDRAQTCALKRMAEQRDPSGCFEFLPNPDYYDPPPASQPLR